jgi:hypothetical protein
VTRIELRRRPRSERSHFSDLLGGISPFFLPWKFVVVGNLVLSLDFIPNRLSDRNDRVRKRIIGRIVNPKEKGIFVIAQNLPK